MGRKSQVGDAWPQQRRILQVLAVGGELMGCDIGKRAKNLPTGTLHATLYKLEDAALVVSRRDSEGGYTGKRRRFYRITARGQRALQLMHELVDVLAGK